jgi:cystathionine beta-lyase/cystathionine gamma-synthase
VAAICRRSRWNPSATSYGLAKAASGHARRRKRPDVTDNRLIHAGSSDVRYRRALRAFAASRQQAVAFGEPFVPPIVNTSVYRLEPDPSGPYQYARWGNPTWTALEEALSILEDAETITFPSGMAAIAAVCIRSSSRVIGSCCRQTATTRFAFSPIRIWCRSALRSIAPDRHG